MYEQILYDVSGPVATITMNRPSTLNALTSRMQAEIRHALHEAEKDDNVIGIILTGAGRGFSAGADMKDLQTISKSGGQKKAPSELKANAGDASLGDNFKLSLTYMLSVRKPILAAVNGACAGMSFAYALLCDMRFVESQAKFTTAFAQRGLIAEHGLSWLLPRLIGSGKALDLLLSARKFTGEEAYTLGIAERLCETGTAVDQARDYIQFLADNAAPESMRLIKAQVYRHLNMNLHDAMEESDNWMHTSLKKPDFKEGVQSFLEKRPPNFKRVKVD